MPGYIPNPTDATQPTDAISAETAQAEFRALKARVNVLALAAGNKVPQRQCTYAGVADANGNAAFLTAGSGGLTTKLLATTAALLLSFANGYSNTGGVDFVGQISVDTDNYWAAIPANNLSFLSIDYNLGTGVLTPTQSLVPPQYDSVYDGTKSGLLHFEGINGGTIFTDDYGNAWSAGGGAKTQTSTFKIGASALGGAGAGNALNGATDYIAAPHLVSLGNGDTGFGIEAWVNASALPGANTWATIVSQMNIGNFGMQLGIYNNAGSIKFAYSISSNGTAFDVANKVQGVTTPAATTWYHLALVYDLVGGTYRLYVNGTQEASTVSALIAMGGLGMVIGAGNNGGATWFNGFVDEFRYSQYCPYPGGIAFAPYLVAQAPAGDWFDITNMVMKSINGAGPTFTIIGRCYVGEVITSGAAPTTLKSYAFRGYSELPYTAGTPSAGAIVTGNHNIGTKKTVAELIIENITGEFGFSPGNTITNPCVDAGTVVMGPGVTVDRTAFSFTMGSSAASFYVPRKDTGATTNTTQANWKYKFRFKREW